MTQVLTQLVSQDLSAAIRGAVLLSLETLGGSIGGSSEPLLSTGTYKILRRVEEVNTFRGITAQIKGFRHVEEDSTFPHITAKFKGGCKDHLQVGIS